MKSEIPSDICVVIVGQPRRGFNLVLEFFLRCNIQIIVVTSSIYKKIYEKHDCKLLLVDCQNLGYGNRNIQRKQVNIGLNYAKQLGYKYALKWRADLYPIKIDFGSLRNMCTRISSYDESLTLHRIVLSYFRCLSVYPDDFSSLPDLFHFGRVEDLLLLWNVDNFNFDLSYNFPKCILNSCEYVFDNDSVKIENTWYKISDVYDTHAELYLIYKSVLAKICPSSLNHTYIYNNFLAPIDSKSIRYCWFDNNRGFRPTFQAPQFPWKSPKKNVTKFEVQHVGWEYKAHFYYWFINIFYIKVNLINQWLLFNFRNLFCR